MYKRLISVLLVFVISLSTYAQQQRTAMPANTSPAKPGNAKPGPKPYHEVITAQATTSMGLFTVHRIDDRVYFELADSLLGRDFLVISRISTAGAGMRSGNPMTGYAGDELNQSMIRFEKGPNNKIFIREISFNERSKDSTASMYRAVMNSNLQPIVMAFDAKAIRQDSATGYQSTVFDITDAINSDNDLLFFGPAKGKFGISAYQPDKSYLLDVKTFPLNTEISTVKTYGKNPAARTGSSGTPASPNEVGPKSVTMILNTSFVLLPELPMQPRYSDDRVGYFRTSYTDFDADPQGVKKRELINRWRLEPKEADREKYNRGELVEPAKPIVIYIDPATPAKWAPYLIQGINDWQAAFEKAGFKNAIIGKRAPTAAEDPSWSLEDARHSVLVYKPSEVANASGPQVVDPRSGEVIETHINWYHNIMRLLHDWYFVQAAAVDTGARTMHFSDELMGRLIRTVASHEVGHTLGLLHNFGSSAATPVEKLRDKKWLEANGHTASIMDYARFNYVAQPEDSITEEGLFPRIGVYDKWAIEWGYRLIPEATSPEEEVPVLNQWIIAKANDKRYWFGTERNSEDPRCQSEDLGDNAMKAGEYGIRNLKRVMKHLPEWTKENNEGYENLRHMHEQVIDQFSRYVIHVINNIGGRYKTIKTAEQPGPVYELVPAEKQAEALRFITTQVFATPEWLVDNKILSLTGSSPLQIITSLQENTLGKLLGSMLLNSLLTAEATGNKTYKLTSLMAALRKGVWQELDTKQPIDIYRRNLQKLYVDKLRLIVAPPAAAKSSDVTAIARAELVLLRAKMRTALAVIQDSMTRYHLQDLIGKIDNTLRLQ